MTRDVDGFTDQTELTIPHHRYDHLTSATKNHHIRKYLYLELSVHTTVCHSTNIAKLFT